MNKYLAEKILKPFCAQHQIGRFDMRRPYVQDGFINATDGHVACRIPDFRTHEYKARESPVIRAIIPDRPFDGTVLVKDLLSQELIDLSDAVTTYGDKLEDAQCEWCSGEGHYESDSGSSVKCKKCGGRGHLLGVDIKRPDDPRIHWQKGYGYINLQFGEVMVGVSFIRKIQLACEFAEVTELLFSTEENQVVAFKGKDIEFYLMPVRGK